MRFRFAQPRLLRQAFGAVSAILLASCSGGGCSNGCSGTTPLPGGFPKDKAVENAASVRISRPGLDFLEENLPTVVGAAVGGTGGKITFPIPATKVGPQSILGPIEMTANICEGGPAAGKCEAQVDVGKSTFLVDAVKPNAVAVKATIPLQLTDTPVKATFTGGVNITLHIGYGDGTCNKATPVVKPHALPVRVSIPFAEETLAPRNGYTKIDVDNAAIDLSQLDGDQVRICADCSGLGPAENLCNAALNASFVKDTIVDQLKKNLDSQVKSLLGEQLCTVPNPTCPIGSSPDASGKKCVFDANKNKCVPMLLGTDSHVNLGGLLAGISPGTAGALDFGLAAGGQMRPLPGAAAGSDGRTTNGITLSMIGGVIPQPPSKCVPLTEVAVPTGIPVPDEIAPTAAEAAGSPHLKIALAGRFLEYALGSVYNSGVLCLGISSEQVDMLKSSLLSILIPSIKTLTFERGDAAAAITTRPQAPPAVKLGAGTDADPLITLSLPKFAVDFYIWNMDRFVRAFTFQADLTIPVNLQTGKDPVKNPNGGIIPALGDIKVENASVTNTELLTDNPGIIAASLAGLIGGLSKQLLGGGIAPIDLASALAPVGLGLQIDGITKLNKDSDDFLGIFATMAKSAGAATAEARVTARLVSKTVHADKMQLETFDPSARPELVVDAASDLGAKAATEFSWWIDRGTHSAWTRDGHLVIRDDQLLLQGRHVLHVTARQVGLTATESTVPADLPFVIDAVAPFVRVDKQGTKAAIDAWDLVSAPEALVARYRLDGGEFSEFRPVAELAAVEVGAASTIDVEARDEEGNVRSISQDLVRGHADSTLGAVGSGCGCSTPGGAREGGGGWMAIGLGVAGLGLVMLRRRAARSAAMAGFQRVLGTSRAAGVAVSTIGIMAAASQGCSCGGNSDSGTGCGADCNSACAPGQGLGMPGAYTSVARAADGTLWVAGYNDALLDPVNALLYGDLVVGKFDGAKGRVDWQTVDGLPERADGTCAPGANDAWRRGETESGDNVGLWTSIQVSPSGHPMVSFYDATNRRLKFAVEDGGWHVSVLKELPDGDAGRYSKMLIVDGKPVIAYLEYDSYTDKTRSKVVVARATKELPREAADFTFVDAAVVEDNPCMADACAPGSVCVKSSGTCTAPATGCEPACAAGQGCVEVDGKATCSALMGGLTSYPNVFGAYISLAHGPTGLGITAYDRVRGNLIALAESGDGFRQTLLDGETGDRAKNTVVDTGDVGIASSLFIDDGNVWHVSYVNGFDESVRYITMQNGIVGTAEVVDDGTSVDGNPFADGKHVVGDDSVIRVESGVVTILYQDATVGVLRQATGTSTTTGHSWTLRAIPQEGKFAGYFPQFVPGEKSVTNFWRQTDPASATVTGDVSLLTP